MFLHSAIPGYKKVNLINTISLFQMLYKNLVLLERKNKYKVIHDCSPTNSTTYNKFVSCPEKEQITGEALHYLSEFIKTNFNERELRVINDKIRFIN